MTITAVPGVQFAMIDGDGVCLDLDSDTYFCLADLEAHLDLAVGGSTSFTTEGAHMLIETGLFRADAAGIGPTEYIAPRETTLDMTEAQADWIDRWHFVLAMLHATFRGRGRRIRDLMGETRHDPPRSKTAEIVVRRRAVLFQRWLPWVPFQGRCLYRAFMLREFLRLAKQDADWIVGVRTWPFEAHCWLQADALLLDDDIDRVSVYTPILVA